MERVYNTGMSYFKSWMSPTVDLSSCEGECGTIVEAVVRTIVTTNRPLHRANQGISECPEMRIFRPCSDAIFAE